MIAWRVARVQGSATGGRARPTGAAGPPTAGVTLVEVLIALTILAVVLLPVMVGFSQALITTSRSSLSVVATNIARQKVEELKAQDYASLQSQARQRRDYRPGDAYFEVEVTVAELRPNDAAKCGLKQAVVTVYQRGSSQPIVNITTFFTPIGV
jgi:prepilin-type N-terminal cleavage/methylation domain-containing protein